MGHYLEHKHDKISEKKLIELCRRIGVINFETVKRLFENVGGRAIL